MRLPASLEFGDCSLEGFHMRTRRKAGRLFSALVLRRNFGLRLRLQPSIDVLAHHILGETVTLLDYTLKLFALSVDLGQIVICEFAPLLFDLALSLFPISFDAVPVHLMPPSSTA